jgi:hypothetical protein
MTSTVDSIIDTYLSSAVLICYDELAARDRVLFDFFLDSPEMTEEELSTFCFNHGLLELYQEYRTLKEHKALAAEYEASQYEYADEEEDYHSDCYEDEY